MSEKVAIGRVLVVDDDEAVLKYCTRALKSAGFEVETTSDPVGAVARAPGFDLVLSDIQMPAMSGVELLRRVRERDLDVPVMLMTGDPSIDTAVRAVEYGALRYFTKPFDVAELIAAAQNAVRLRRLAEAKREALQLLGKDAMLVGDRAGLEATFGRAIESLWMAYQPILSLSKKTIFGFEALLRSREPALPHPGAVLDAAERLDRVQQVGRVVRERVAAGAADAPEGSLLFVNLHAADLRDEHLMSPAAPLSQIATSI